MQNIRYGFEVALAPDVGFEQAKGRVIAALGEEGFGILTEIDVKATLKKKLDVDFRRYVILGACNPGLARQALEAEAQVGLLLPCNVVVQEQPDGIIVSILDPKTMLTLVDNPKLAPVAEEAQLRLRRVVSSLDQGKEGSS